MVLKATYFKRTLTYHKWDGLTYFSSFLPFFVSLVKCPHGDCPEVVFKTRKRKAKLVPLHIFHIGSARKYLVFIKNLLIVDYIIRGNIW